jgi:hypothetical protein
LDVVWTWGLLFLLRNERVEFIGPLRLGYVAESTLCPVFWRHDDSGQDTMDVRKYLFELFIVFRRYRRSLETIVNVEFYLFISLF